MMKLHGALPLSTDVFVNAALKELEAQAHCRGKNGVRNMIPLPTVQLLLSHTIMMEQTKETVVGMLGLLWVKKEIGLLYWVAIKVALYASMPMTRIQ